MVTMLDNKGLPGPNRTNIHFTLGEIYDDLECCNEAFENFEKQLQPLKNTLGPSFWCRK